ncbi:TIGR03943 family putative permease subunit [Oribacterium sp. WCC10]|uniref:TIGR03943 family putative permease subunit n=1 Tax=Oribacterium sp. WCC10 TaxID=1855343 RepID=UPI0008E16A50|nr:GTP-binding protein [Oribacterium sp. WCC10]SFG56379.1 CobW/HypB/UreG, nucleotide-binding domain [Oribacterium sp. WCC10]
MATSDNYELRDDQIPVFLINGFLEAGKTDFIKYTMAQEYFQAEGTTLLLLCEEGESEYDDATLEKYHTVKVVMENETDFNEENLKKLQEQYNPERIIIEWNGMWNQDDLFNGPMSEVALAEQQGRDPEYVLSLPESWVIYQVITIINGATLDLYLNNMKSFIGQMLRQAELCIVNRCDNIPNEKLVDYRRKLRAMGQNAMLVLEGKDGEIPQDTLPEDLPYDINQPSFAINPEDYGTWFVDCMDNPDRYIGKEITFTAMVLKRNGSPKNEIVPGRMAMTCCAQDMTFLGYVAKADPAVLAPYNTRDWAKITAVVGMEEREEYGGEGPVLDIKKIVRTGAIDDAVTF